MGFGAIILLALFLFPLHAPLSDDLSMIAFSKVWSFDWINKGLGDYFIVYPEYYGPQSNFIRPVSNLVYWLFSALLPFDAPFFANRIQLIVLNYGMLIVIAVSLYLIVMRIAQDRIHALLAMLATLLLPPYWMTPTPTYTSFVFDGLAIMLCLFAMFAFDKRRIMTMSMFLTLALLTKEIALPVVGAFAIVFLIKWHRRAFIASLLPILIWGALRFHAFGFDAAGVYVFESGGKALSAFLEEKIRNILTLPFGPVYYETIVTDQGLAFANRSGALLLANIALYAILIYLAVNWFAKRKKTESDHSRKQIDPRRRELIRIACVATLFSFLFDGYIGANYRYAFNFLPFLFIVVAASYASRFTKTSVLLVCVLASAIASQPAFARLYHGLPFEALRYEVIRDLFATLRTHKGKKPLIIVNDFVLGYADPKALEILVPTQTPLIRGTSLYLDGCPERDLYKIETTIDQKKNEIVISSKLPDCARFTFESAPKLANFVAGEVINRNEAIEYRFIPASNSAFLDVPGWTGRDLTIITRGSDVLYYDFQKKDWILIKAEN